MYKHARRAPRSGSFSVERRPGGIDNGPSTYQRASSSAYNAKIEAQRQEHLEMNRLAKTLWRGARSVSDLSRKQKMELRRLMKQWRLERAQERNRLKRQIQNRGILNETRPSNSNGD